MCRVPRCLGAALLSSTVVQVQAAQLEAPQIRSPVFLTQSSAPPQKKPPTIVAPIVPMQMKAPTIVAPMITGYKPIGCVKADGALSIIGSGFGANQDGQGVALGGSGIHVDLIVDRWSDTLIGARIPRDPRIKSNQWYYTGIERTGHGKWLSNIDRSFRICEVDASSVATPFTLPTLQPPAMPNLPSPPIKPPSKPVIAGEKIDAPPILNKNGNGVNPQARSTEGPAPGLASPMPPLTSEYRDNPVDESSSEPDEVLIVSPDLQRAVLAQKIGQGLGLTVKRRTVLQGLGLVITIFQVPATTTPMQALQLLRSQVPDLLVDVNHRFTLQGTDDARTYPARMIGWPDTVQSCGRGVRVGIVDGELPKRHQVLDGGRITQRSFVTSGGQTGASEHALAIAAILIGRDGRGLIPAVTLFNAAVMRQDDKKHVDTTVDRLAQGLDWLAQQRVDLINLSLGGPHNLILDAVIKRLLALNIQVIAAAGNRGPNAAPVYPAAQQGVIAVTAIDAGRHLYRHANRGDYVAFAAPGVDVWVPNLKGNVFASGTSFATPYVTAIFAARRQLHRRLSWAEHFKALATTAEDLGDPGRDPLFGFGLPQAQLACGANEVGRAK